MPYRHNNHFAYGQVIVIPLPIGKDELDQLEITNTAMIIKPKAGWNQAYFKFPGGMKGENQTFKEAAVSEVRDECGIHSPIEGLVEIDRFKKKRGGSHQGYFDVVTFVAFDSDFSKMFNPLFEEFGDEGEEAQRIVFGNIMKPMYQHDIATKPGETAGMFRLHVSILERVFAGARKAAS